MGWFDEQVKLRKQYDDENFADAFGKVADAVMGKRLTSSIENKEVAKTAIGEVLKYYHLKMPKEEILREFDTVEDQVSFYMRKHSIMFREVELDEGWYSCAIGPMITSLNDGTVIAVIPSKIFGYKYFDYRTNKYIAVNKKTAASISKNAICFYRPFPLRKLTVVDLYRFMISLYTTSDIIIYFATMLITSLVGFVSPLATKWLFSDVIESESMISLMAITVFMVSFSIANILIGAFTTMANSRLNSKQDIIIQAAVMNRIISLPPTFFKEYSSGELSQRSSYVMSLCNTLMSSVTSILSNSLFSIIYIGQIFLFAPALVIPSLVITLLTVSTSIIFTFWQSRLNKESMLLSTKESGLSYSMIKGIQKIKLAGAEKRMFSRWAKMYAQNVSYRYNPPTLIKLRGTISMAISLLGNLVLYYCAVMSHVSVSDYYAFTSSYGMVSASFMSLASLTFIFADIKPTLDMAKPIMDAIPESGEDKEMLMKASGAIELSNVSFRYTDNMPMVIDDLSLKIEPGEYLAIVGTTGCGKSTLLRLMLGFEKPVKGAVYYDKKDIKNLDLRTLRQNIGVVMQDGKLFTGDIYSNITISAPQMTVDDAWEAAEIASIADDIREMPMGMFTMISEGQGGISGGQKQRLMIARAVAPKPHILMFDEATSALDNITQKKVSEAIDSLKCTRIVIAHRLSTIRHCSRIVVLDKGKIIEDGTYEELIKNNGLFAELVERQRLDIDVE